MKRAIVVATAVVLALVAGTVWRQVCVFGS